MSIDVTHPYEWRGRNLVGSDGDKIGKIEEIYLDEQGGQPEWGLVNTSLFGNKSNFVPLAGAAPEGENVRVSVMKAQVKEAPASIRATSSRSRRRHGREAAVPKERVRLDKDTVTDRQVSEEVRKEQIEGHGERPGGGV